MKTLQVADWKHSTGRAPHRRSGVVEAFGVTIAFAAGSFAVALLLISVATPAISGVISAGSQRIFEQSASLFGYAILAGLLVDFLRFLGDRRSKGAPPHSA